MTKKREHLPEKLVDTIIEALKNLKAVDIVSVDLKNVSGAVCKYFVICNGTSNTHVSALADNVEDETLEKLNEKVWRVEGKQNAQWVLLDYADVVVHVFQKEYRDYYQLEQLWADANITCIPDVH
ncbi:ribosome silencing factor [Ancylomarina euxinus]|uniref:Ribosomal silencing factor RsfS n=1 Tax=Ancylomarina euxinus TaxID=2283627 RepID=A0A425Y388_9BACT|nr:ribosome silencing factor [Ancylomarina euxinus]MCZ4693147.1 ribosome silencing factor [Ancylomarina euxinus]MUP15285.1 ribosome silencing factor [Ancylomarina euxinus]RRG22585.1 ribosome silencing factor [Ancylomarina euxinus]